MDVNLQSFSEEMLIYEPPTVNFLNNFLHISLSIFYDFTGIFKKFALKTYGLNRSQLTMVYRPNSIQHIILSITK